MFSRDAHLLERAGRLRSDPYHQKLIAAAVEERAAQADAGRPGHLLAEPLTAAKQRVLTLLPASTYLQTADTPGPDHHQLAHPRRSRRLRSAGG